MKDRVSNGSAFFMHSSNRNKHNSLPANRALLLLVTTNVSLTYKTVLLILYVIKNNILTKTISKYFGQTGRIAKYSQCKKLDNQKVWICRPTVRVKSIGKFN